MKYVSVILLAALCVSFVPSGSAVKCFVCRDGPVFKSFPPEVLDSPSCNPLTDSLLKECNYCWKMEGYDKITKKQSVARLCGTSAEDCIYDRNFDETDLKVGCYSCKGDSCNSSNDLIPSMFTAFVVSFVSYFYCL